MKIPREWSVRSLYASPFVRRVQLSLGSNIRYLTQRRRIPVIGVIVVCLFMAAVLCITMLRRRPTDCLYTQQFDTCNEKGPTVYPSGPPTNDSSYVSFDPSQNLFFLSRPADEPPHRSTDNPDLKFDCHCQKARGSTRNCRDGLTCRSANPKLLEYSDLEEVLHHPFGDRMLLSRSNLKFNESIPFLDAWVRPQVMHARPSLAESLSKFSPHQPWTHERCAVVGHGGVLLNSSFGKQIDSYDAVFRMNENPFESHVEDVGSRADYWILSGQFGTDELERLGMICRIRSTSARVIYYYNQPTDLLVVETIHSLYPDLQIVVLNPQFPHWFTQRRQLLFPAVTPKTWESDLMESHSVMSGTMSVAVAWQLCKTVDVYGFYGYSHALSGELAPYHYGCQRYKRFNLAGRLDFEFMIMLSSLSSKTRRLRIML